MSKGAIVAIASRRPRFRRAAESPAFRVTDDDIEIKAALLLTVEAPKGEPKASHADTATELDTILTGDRSRRREIASFCEDNGKTGSNRGDRFAAACVDSQAVGSPGLYFPASENR